jgi:phospholipase/carboxylesterase
MNASKVKVGELDVTLVKGTDKPKAAVILCHGFGAGGDDLVSIAEEMVKVDANFKEVTFLFPVAPISMGTEFGFESRAWWMIDVDKIQQLAEKGKFRDLRKESPKELPGCNKLIVDVIEYACSEFEIPHSQVVIGGFSQGAMLTTDVALSCGKNLGGLVVWSGTLLCEDKWDSLMGNVDFPVYQSHGTLDPILPFDNAVALCNLFADAKVDIDFTEFEGPHTIPISGMMGAMKMIRKAIL